MSKRIEVGDIVDVYFEQVQCELNCVVEYIPAATGDCWYLWKPDGDIVAVMNFAKMVKKADKKPF